MTTCLPSTRGSPRLRIARNALGLGLRQVHYTEVLESLPEVDYFEAISENFMTDAASPLHYLGRVRAKYPIVLHGVGLNLLGADFPDEEYLDRLCRLADLVDAPFVTDHLCFTSSEHHRHHDLLPVPHVPELVEVAAARAAYVQKRLGRPFGLENLSSYVSYKSSTLTEWDFISAIVEQADCGLLLDVNNVFVSSHNHSFDPKTYLERIDFSRVLQVHMAGHSRDPSGLIVDTHDHLVADSVWTLYKYAWQIGGPFPTLLEWDDKIPPLPVLVDELRKAMGARAC